jgi:hypothetical protein
MADSKDEATKNAGALSAFFYWGKIQGRSPNAALDKLIVDFASKLGEADTEALTKRCGADFKAEIESMSALGARLAAADAQPAAK